MIRKTKRNGVNKSDDEENAPVEVDIQAKGKKKPEETLLLRTLLRAMVRQGLSMFAD